MYNSIQHFNEFGAKRIEKKIKNFIEEGKDLADLILGLKEDLFKLGRDILKEVLEDMDEYLRNCEIRKQYWEIIRKDKTAILTTFGTLSYNRTYFKHKENGNRQHLVDRIVGVEPHDRVSADVVINAIEEAADSSYRKAGEKATYIDEISKQAVMNKIHNIEIVEPEIKVDKKRKVKILYVEADEDHVALQQKSILRQNEKGKRNTIMSKLVYVHEGIDFEKSNKKRKVLKNVRYFWGVYSNSENLWLEVSEYIYKQYDVDFLETVYISGDGASWIRQGVNWLSKSKFVLDRYHLQKYVRVATTHLNDEAISQDLQDALNLSDKKKLTKVFKKIIEKTGDNESKIKAIKSAKRYILNNWDGIEIRSNRRIVGCSAEGHVSHVFSSR